MRNKKNTAILFVNLGTPENLTISSIRKNLKEFLMDKRVIDLPFFLRFIIVYFFILPFRPFKTLKKYQEVWNHTLNLSPFIYYSEQFIKKLKEKIPNVAIDYAMRYGKPTIKEKMQQFYKQGYRYLHIVPLYPQYSTSTYGSLIAEICRVNQQLWDPFILSFEEVYNDDEDFIQLWMNKIQSIKNYQDYYVLFTFHGIPERHIIKSDRLNLCLKEGCCEKYPEYCYKAQSIFISRKIAQKLNIKHYDVVYQSRLGRTKWLTPYLQEYLLNIINNFNKIIIIPLSFTADCLETLEELNISTRKLVEEHNKKTELIVIDSLNDDDEWINYWIKRMKNFF